MGVAVTLAIVLVVLVVLVLLYKRRHQASKLSTNVLAVETVEMQNQSPAEPSQDNQVCSFLRNIELDGPQIQFRNITHLNRLDLVAQLVEH